MLDLGERQACCDRCADGGASASEARIARRRLLKAAIFPYRHEPAAGPNGKPGAAGLGLAAGPGPAAASPGRAASGAPPGPGLSADPASSSRAPAADASASRPGFPDAGLQPRAVTGTIIDVSAQVIVIGDAHGERRFTLMADATAWRGGQLEPSALRPGEQAVIRLNPAQRDVADRIWAGIGRVTGTIIERGRDGLIVDVGRMRKRQLVVIPARATGRIQVRFPNLEPGYLLDVIGIRRSGMVEALVPATSQPAYRSDRLPAPPLLSGHVPNAISGSATWHDCADEPPGVLGVDYPALDPATGCAEDAAGAQPRGYVRMPYLAVGSVLRIRNDCTGISVGLPVTGCAPIARLFNDRCVTCGTSPRGRVADLTLASFVALGGELERGCFNATITVGR